MKTFLIIISIFLITLLQFSILPNFAIFQGVPNLNLAVFLALYALDFKKEALIVSGISALILSLFLENIFGLSFVLLMLFYLFLNWLKRRYLEEYRPIHLALLAIASAFLFGMAELIFSNLKAGKGIPFALTESVLLSSLYTAVTFLVLYFVFGSLLYFLEKRNLLFFKRRRML